MRTPYPDFEIQTHVVPSNKLAETAAADGVDPASIMRDYLAIAKGRDDITVAVGDMANNLVGDTHQDSDLSINAGLPEKYPLNGGLVGSLTLRYSVAELPGTGVRLVEGANDTLADLYARYGMGDMGDFIDPAERFTGYLTHARINGDETVLTAVGDVNAWLNGAHVLGAEKLVDIEKDALITALTDALTLESDLRAQHIMNIVADFTQRGRISLDLAGTLLGKLYSAVDNTETPDRQTVYRPVDDVVTPWQIRELQNKESNEHPWAYGAIDGSHTPSEYVKTLTMPTHAIETLVIATDGSKARAGVLAVRSAADLEAVNSTFGEQTVVTLSK